MKPTLNLRDQLKHGSLEFEKTFRDSQNRRIHVELELYEDDSIDGGIGSECFLKMDSNHHPYTEEACSSLGFVIDHYGLDCDDAPNCLVEIDERTVERIADWAVSNGY